MIRATLAVLIIGACVAGAALAQDGSPMPLTPAAEAAAPFVPQYEERESGRLAGAARYYPPRAIDQGISGFADLCCTARADRSLECEIGREWPARTGFGRASGRITDHFGNLTLESYAELQARPNPVIPVSIIWVVAPISQEDADVLAAARGSAANICAPGMPEPEPIYVTATILRGR